MSTSPRTHYVFDGDNLLHRVSYRRGSDLGAGKPVFDGVSLASFLTSIRHIIFRFMPQRVSVVWDGDRSQRRLALFPEYKKTALREARDAKERATFREEAGNLTRLLKGLGVGVLSLPRREGDDIVWWLALRENLVVVSDDADFFQLIPMGSIVYRPSKKTIVTSADFFSENGYLVEQHLLAKCLLGDDSDNVPGVPKVGEKTVQSILSTSPHISTPESLYEALPKIDLTPARRASLEESRGVVQRNWDVLRIGEEFLPTEVQVLEASLAARHELNTSVQFELRKLGMFQPGEVPFGAWVDPFRMIQ